MTSSIPSTARGGMASRRHAAGSRPGRLAEAAGRQPSSHPLAHIFNPIPPARLVHPVATQHFCFPPRRVLPAGQARPRFVTGISCQRANVLPWHGTGRESEDGAGSTPDAVTAQGSQGRNLPPGCPRSNLGWDRLGPCQTQVAGFNLQRMEVCLLRRSEILRGIYFPAWGMGVSGGNRAVPLWEASLAALSLLPLPGQCLVSACSVSGRFLTVGEPRLFP